MAHLTHSQHTQHRLLALAATGVLLASTATAVTWRVPEHGLDALAGARSTEQLLVELGRAAGDTLTLAQQSNAALGRSAVERPGVTRASTAGTGGTTVRPTGMLPIPQGDPGVTAAGTTVPSHAPGQITAAPRPAAPGADPSAVLDTGHHSAGRDELPRQLSVALDTITGLALRVGGPALTSVTDQLGDAIGATLTELARATSGTDLAAATGALADASHELSAAVQALGASQTGDALGPQLGLVQHHLTLVIAAIEDHGAALDQLADVGLPALPRMTRDGRGELAEALDGWNAVIDTVAASTVADAVARAGADGSAVSEAAAQLAWAATDAATAARAARALATAATDGASQLAPAAAGSTFAVRLASTHAASQAVAEALLDAATSAAALGGLPASLHAQICGTLGCAPGLPLLESSEPTTPDTPEQPIAGLPAASTTAGIGWIGAPDATDRAPSLPALVEAADVDRDGDVDRDDLHAAGDSASLVIGVVLRHLDVDGDGAVDETDAAATIATTPIGLVAATLRAQSEVVVVGLATALRAAGTHAQLPGDPTTLAAAELLAAADTDGDGQPDRAGIVGLYHSGNTTTAPVDVTDAVVTLRRTVAIGLDRNGDGSLTISDSGCVSQAYGIYANDSRRDLETLHAGAELDPSSLAALTVVQLARSCALHADQFDGDGARDATDARQPDPDATLAAVQAQIIGLIGAITPRCTSDPISCTIAFENVSNGIANAAQARLVEATQQLARTLDVNDDGSINRTDGNAFGNRSFDAAWSASIDALDAIDGTVDGHTSSTAQALFQSRPTTADVLAIGRALDSIATGLTDALDIDGDGDIDEADARTLGDALGRELPATPAEAPSTLPVPVPTGPTGTTEPPSKNPSENQSENQSETQGEGPRDVPAPTPTTGVDVPTIPADLPTQLPALPVDPATPTLPAVPARPTRPALPQLPDPSTLGDGLGTTVPDVTDSPAELPRQIPGALKGDVTDVTEPLTEPLTETLTEAVTETVGGTAAPVAPQAATTSPGAATNVLPGTLGGVLP